MVLEFFKRRREVAQLNKNYRLQNALWGLNAGEVKEALHAGAEADTLTQERHFQKPLIAIPVHNYDEKVAREFITLLLQAGADPDRKGYEGNTALHEAAVYGKTGIMTFLVQSGADPRVTNDKGETPLAILQARMARGLEHADRYKPEELQKDQENLDAFAALVAHFDATKATRQKLVDFKSQSMEMLLTQPEKDSQLWRSLGSPKALRAALVMGADKNAQNGRGETPLMAALDFKGAIMFDQLKAYTGEKEKETLKKMKWTERLKHKFMNFVIEGLIAAGDADRMKVAEILIDAGADVTKADQEGKTALMNAVILNGVQGGADKVIRKLVDAGADLNATLQGHSVLDWAIATEKQPGIVKLLQKKGAKEIAPVPKEAPPAAPKAAA